jgi:hypothetical protein
MGAIVKYTVAERFWKKVNKDGPIPAHCPELGNCWVWTGSVTQNFGYGQLAVNNRPVRAHRLAWFLETGEQPTEHVLHKCDNPPCIRFTHLFQGTPADNARDCLAKDRNPRDRIINLVGLRFGNLIVESFASLKPTKFNCRCDCGRATIVLSGHLRNGHTTTCGNREDCPYRQAKKKGWRYSKGWKSRRAKAR